MRFTSHPTPRCSYLRIQKFVPLIMTLYFRCFKIRNPFQRRALTYRETLIAELEAERKRVERCIREQQAKERAGFRRQQREAAWQRTLSRVRISSCMGSPSGIQIDAAPGKELSTSETGESEMTNNDDAASHGESESANENGIESKFYEYYEGQAPIENCEDHKGLEVHSERQSYECPKYARSIESDAQDLHHAVYRYKMIDHRCYPNTCLVFRDDDCQMEDYYGDMKHCEFQDRFEEDEEWEGDYTSIIDDDD